MTKKNLVLVADGIFNMALGGALVFFPAQLIEALNLPKVEMFFYVNLLGALIFGMGMALVLERFAGNIGVTGLGIGGALLINLCAVTVLFFWLGSGNLEISRGGTIVLWSAAIIVLGIIVIELVTNFWKTEK